MRNGGSRRICGCFSLLVLKISAAGQQQVSRKAGEAMFDDLDTAEKKKRRRADVSARREKVVITVISLGPLPSVAGIRPIDYPVPWPSLELAARDRWRLYRLCIFLCVWNSFARRRRFFRRPQGSPVRSQTNDSAPSHSDPDSCGSYLVVPPEADTAILGNARRAQGIIVGSFGVARAGFCWYRAGVLDGG